MSYVKNQNADVMLLQGTHLLRGEHGKLNRPWIGPLGQIFHSQFNCKTRGTAILIKKNVQFAPSKIIADPEGRYTIVSGILYQKPVVFTSIYAPNWDDHNFFNSMLSLIPNLDSNTLILGGDLNCAIDPVLHRSSPRLISPSRTSQTLSAFMDQFGYVDPWTFMYPSIFLLLASPSLFFPH